MREDASFLEKVFYTYAGKLIEHYQDNKINFSQY